MNLHGVGDRWLAGEQIPGVAFHLNDMVRLSSDSGAGETGAVSFLLAVRPEPLYLVRLDGGRELRVRQSALEAAGE